MFDHRVKSCLIILFVFTPVLGISEQGTCLNFKGIDAYYHMQKPYIYRQNGQLKGMIIDVFEDIINVKKLSVIKDSAWIATGTSYFENWKIYLKSENEMSMDEFYETIKYPNSTKFNKTNVIITLQNMNAVDNCKVVIIHNKYIIHV